MDTITRSAVRQRRREKRDTRRDSHKQRQTNRREKYRARKARREAASRLMSEKLEALRAVNAVCAETAERLASAFTSRGTLVWVCNWKGPHHGAWCFLHGRRRVVLLPISGSQVYEREPLQLGTNGRIYRHGRYKTYEANLLERGSASDISALTPNLTAMN